MPDPTDATKVPTIPTQSEREADYEQVHNYPGDARNVLRKYITALEYVEREKDAAITLMSSAYVENNTLRAQLAAMNKPAAGDGESDMPDAIYRTPSPPVDDLTDVIIAAASNAQRLKQAEGLLREWWDHYCDRTISGWQMEFAGKVRKALGISPIITSDSHQPIISPPSAAEGGGE